MSHTPGPWRYRKYLVEDADRALMEANGMNVPRALTNDGGVVIMGPERRVAVADSQTDYKRGKGHEVECAERDANARLIAAAPELLAALEAVTFQLDLVTGGSGQVHDERQAIIKARAAIAKATGDT